MVRELPAVFSAIICYIGLFLIGFEGGYVSPTAHALIQDTPLTIHTLPVFAGMIFTGSLLMQCILSLISRKVHTKALLIVSTLSGCIGWLTAVVSHDVYTMLFGRFLLGVQTSVLFLGSVYLGEIVALKRRRFYCSGVSLAIRFSLVLVYLIGIWVSFRWLAVVAIVIEVVFVCLMVVNPISPVWLIRQDLENSARRTISCLHGETINSDSDITHLRYNIEFNRTKLSQLFNWKVIKPILTVTSVTIFNPLCGIPAIISYSSEILSAQYWISSNVAALFFPAMLLIGNVIGQQLVSRYSLRVILITATTLQLLSHISMASYFAITDYLLKCAIDKSNANICDNLSFWPVLNLTVFGLSSGIGFDSITFTLFGEAFEENNRESYPYYRIHRSYYFFSNVVNVYWRYYYIQSA